MILAVTEQPLTFPPTEIFAAISILIILAGAAIWVLDTTYLRKKAFHEMRTRDKDERDRVAADHEEKRQEITMKINEQGQKFDLFTTGPMGQLTVALGNLEKAVAKLDAAAEHRQDKLMGTLVGFEHRLTTVETRQQAMMVEDTR
jgi:hypothetical protein